MQNEKTSLKELAGLFIRLGLTAFGGPAAHIAMMQKEVVENTVFLIIGSAFLGYLLQLL